MIAERDISNMSRFHRVLIVRCISRCFTSRALNSQNFVRVISEASARFFSADPKPMFTKSTGPTSIDDRSRSDARDRAGVRLPFRKPVGQTRYRRRAKTGRRDNGGSLMQLSAFERARYRSIGCVCAHATHDNPSATRPRETPDN